MVTGTFLASTVIMGLLAAGVFYVAVNGRSWKRYSPQALGTDWSGFGFVSDSRAWILGFVVLTVAAVVAIPTVLEGGADASGLIFGSMAALTVSFLLFGTYATARSRGHPHSHAVAEAIGMFGAVVILAIVGNLVIQFGA